MTTKLFNRSGRGEAHVEGNHYLNVGGQFTTDASHKYITTGGHLTTIEVGPKPDPSQYTIWLPDTVDGSNMFANKMNVKDEKVYAPVMENGTQMFLFCMFLTSFSGDLSSLTNGTSMFSGCSKLASFDADLSSLENGNLMFQGCKLDLTSVNRIVNSLPTYTSGTHTIAIGVDSTQVTQEQQDEATAILADKGWTAMWRRS